MKYILFLFLVFVLASSCRKDVEFTNSPVSLTFSTDTINFDTIFSLKDSGKIGLPKSITLRLIVTNPNESAIKTSIQMEGNQNGLFKLNADGISGNGNLQKIENIEILGKDSIYIFVQTYINPLNFTPSDEFAVVDSILFTTNGNRQKVVTVSYPQDANYFQSETLKGNEIWTIEKPFVIYDDILVDKGATLTINPGVKIYSHNNSTIYVAGTIKILGTIDNPVVLQGDRLDDDYKEVSNQWNGIHILSTSVNNVISCAIIKNGFIGIRVDSLSMNLNPKLELSQTIIQDMGAVGLLSYSAHVKATNNLISNCGQYCFLGDLGGKYEFTFNTFAATGGTQARKNATFTITNTPFRDANNNITVFPLSYTLINNIIWGSNDDEINFVRDEQGITNTAIVKNNNIKSELFRDELLANSANINSNQITLDPSFVDANKKNYKIKGGSVCSGQGNKSTGISFDITNKFRSNPSIGAYEPD